MAENPIRKKTYSQFSVFRYAAAATLLLLASGCASTGAKKGHNPSFTPPTLMSTPEPIPPAGAPPASLAPTGSLWNAGSRSYFSDVKACRVGDLVTITVSENSTGSNTAATSGSKTSTSTGTLSYSGLGLGAAGVKAPTGAVSFGPYNTSFNRTFTGTGSTSQAGSVTAYMTATVVSVLPNGNLVIRGTRWTKVNDELQQIVLEGVVRPVDISNTNTVLSQDVAEAKIFMLGKGPVAQYQKPGWLEQIWNVISPF